MEAVTTQPREWRCAAMAAQMSIQAISVPPNMVPTALACEGKTSSVMETRESEGGRGVRSGEAGEVMVFPAAMFDPSRRPS
jgi:hypothetical protein